MTASKPRRTLDLSRRRFLGRASLIAAGGALAAAGAVTADAQTKVAQKLVSYQPTPKGKARCDNCVNWQPPAGCKLVQGTIAASGWCSIYAPKH